MAETEVRPARVVLPREVRIVAVIIVVVAVVAGVLLVTGGNAPTSVAPSAAPSVLVTPNPHLPSTATAQDVFNGLGHAGLQVTAHTASLGAAGSPIVRKIFATYLGWPLDVTEYRSASALAEAETWESGLPPEKGDPPITIAGGNILVIWGPIAAGRAPVKLDERQRVGLQPLVSALDLLLSPLRTRTSVPVLVSATAAPSVAPSAEASPSAKPKASGKPSKATPKP